jgi:hypothetical protein
VEDEVAFSAPRTGVAVCVALAAVGLALLPAAATMGGVYPPRILSIAAVALVLARVVVMGWGLFMHFAAR